MTAEKIEPKIARNSRPPPRIQLLIIIYKFVMFLYYFLFMNIFQLDPQTATRNVA